MRKHIPNSFRLGFPSLQCGPRYLSHKQSDTKRFDHIRCAIIQELANYQVLYKANCPTLQS